MTIFTEQQASAIEYRRMDACVVAGPGSGKTTVLVERYRSLVEDHGFSPDQILAITFTEKAAANMKARVAQEFRGNEARLRELDRAWVSTIHGFCARVLKENAIAARADPRFVVLDAREAEDLRFERLNAALDEFTEERRTEILALIEALQKPFLHADLLDAWDAIRSSGKSTAEVRAMPSPVERASAAELAREMRALLQAWPANLTPVRRTHQNELFDWSCKLDKADGLSLAEWLQFLSGAPFHFGKMPPEAKDALRDFEDRRLLAITDAKIARFRELIFDILARFETLYTTAKAERAALDFDDLERYTIAMLEANPAVRDRLRRQFRQVMLDEFQDINDQQSRLIGLIRDSGVFFGVGDINQSIYGFRHARPDIFERYQAQIEREGKHSARLFKNFRSQDGILRCVETLLSGAEGIERRELIAKEPPGDSGPVVEVMRVIEDDEDESGARGAKWIAYRILQLREEHGHEFRDFAILCRSGESMKPILGAFDDASIPYVCGRRDSVLTSREGRDLTALLSTISNPRDTVSLATVLRSPLAGISDEALLRLGVLANSIAGGLNVVAHDKSRLAEFGEDDAERLWLLIANLARWRAESATMPVDLLLGRALADCGFAWEPGTVTGENIESFLRIARPRGAHRLLAEFLDQLKSLEKAVDTESDLSDEDQGDRVQVMTAHAAKGLEFPVTIIASMQRGVQRDTTSISFTPEHGLGIRWRSPANNRGAKDSWQAANGECLKRRDKEEGNRLLYVAMTRAEERLILSWSTDGARAASNWAGLVENLFGLKNAPPAGEARVETMLSPNGSQWTAAVRVTAEDPPRLSARVFDYGPEIEIVPAAPAAARADSGIAVTSLALFHECPRKYYLARYAGWSPRSGRKPDFEDDPDEPEALEPSAAELGTEVHSALAGKPGEYSNEAMRLADVFRKSTLGRRAATAPKIEREWEFMADIDGFFVRGSIDLWFEEADGAVTIIDYKTDAVSAAEVPARAFLYTTQLAFYALALERKTGASRIRAFLHFLSPDVVYEVEVGPSAIESALKLAGAVRAAQNELRFDLNEGSHCRSCAYFRELCPAPLAAHAA